MCLFVCFNTPSEVPLNFFFYNFTPAEPVYPLAVKCSVAVFKETSGGGLTDVCVCCFLLNPGVLWHRQQFMFYYLTGQIEDSRM